MRRSRFTESEILHLLYEAGSGVPVAEICDTAAFRCEHSIDGSELRRIEHHRCAENEGTGV